MVASMAKASMTSETCRCHPCQERVSLWSRPSSFLAISKLSTNDVALFLDVDMGILGTPTDVFAAYEAGIEAEYAPIHGTERYRAGRAMVLSDFLSRDRLFLSDHFHGLLEQQARNNITALVERLIASFKE